MKNTDLSDVLIVSDFDGTLRSDFGYIPERNIIAIERLKEKGGSFIVASGRAGFVLDIVDPTVKDLVNAPCVYSNGSYLYDYATGEKFNEKYISEEKVRDILFLIRDTAAETGIRMVRGNEYLTPDANDEIKRQIAMGYMHNVRVYNFDTVPVDRINKLTACAPNDKVLKIKDALEKEFPDTVEPILSGISLLDIQPKNVSKGTSINEIREQYKLSGRKVRIFAVGDYDNDIEMLQCADYSCCPSNALKNVKEICKIHLCSNNDGAIADLIERIENNLV